MKKRYLKMIRDNIPGNYRFGPERGIMSKRDALRLADDVERELGVVPKVKSRIDLQTNRRRFFVIHKIGLVALITALSLSLSSPVSSIEADHPSWCGTQLPDIQTLLERSATIPLRTSIRQSSEIDAVYPIGVMFLFTSELSMQVAASRASMLIEVANSALERGVRSSTVRLDLAGVFQIPHEMTFDPTASPAQLSGVFTHLRESVGGDIVSILTSRSLGDGISGRAEIWFYKDRLPHRSAFNIVRISSYANFDMQATEGLTFLHEIGHNLGLMHDIETLKRQAPGIVDLLPFIMHHPDGVGYKGKSFGTVMSYSHASLRLMGLSMPVGTLQGRDGYHRIRGSAGTNADEAIAVTARIASKWFYPRDRDCCYNGMYTTNGTYFTIEWLNSGRWQEAVLGTRAGDSGIFWFFDASNLEVFGKVLDARSIDGTLWAYASGLTDFPIRMIVFPPGASYDHWLLHIPPAGVMFNRLAW